MCKLFFLSGHFPPVDTPFQKAPQPDFDASLCISKFDSFSLSDLSLFNLKFSTQQRSSCFDRLILYLPCINKPDLVVIFVVPVNILAVDELAELRGQLRTSDLSILLIPKQWFESQKGDYDISKLPVPSFFLLVPKSWFRYLVLDLKILFAWMILGLNFSV